MNGSFDVCNTGEQSTSPVVNPGWSESFTVNVCSSVSNASEGSLFPPNWFDTFLIHTADSSSESFKNWSESNAIILEVL